MTPTRRLRPLGHLARLACAGAALLLPGCLSAPIDRADRAASLRIEQAATEARQLAQAAAGRVDDVRAAAVADVAARVSAERAATLADVDARLTTQREAARRDAEALLARVETESGAWRAVAARGVDESAAWRAEVTAWRAEVASVRAAFVSPEAVDRGGSPTPATGDDQTLLWAALAGTAFTFAKTGVRLWKARKA